MSLNIALHTTQIPYVTSPHQEVIAIIDITPKRAIELLELMNDITARACASSTTFKDLTETPAYSFSHDNQQSQYGPDK
jgi:hypothetical protein